MSDDFERMPGGGGILYSELRNFKERKDFTVTFTDGKDYLIEFDDSVYFDYCNYFDIWNNTREFGLPHGNGWINELQWTIDFLKMFNLVYIDIQNYREDKRRI